MSAGRIILGKWRLDRCLGQGGMGTVYLAHDLSIDREVALKFLHPSLVALDEYRSRFEREARVMAQVEHPNLVTLYGIEHEGAAPFLVMKFVPGRTLSRIKRAGPMPLVEVLPLVVQMAAALSALHARGFVHRDLKPGNVMVDTSGHVTVLDFGLTRTSEQNLTRPGVTLGSPQYMSPEQVMGSAIDARSDLYTLGLVTSELLVGHRPYGSDEGPLALMQHLEAEPEPAHVANPAVPEPVSQVLLKALRKRPADRQPTVAAFVEELIGAAQLGPLQLPRRNTAEAMLDAMGQIAAKHDGGVPAVTPMEQRQTEATVDDLSAVSSMAPRWTQALEDEEVEKPLTVAARNLPPAVPPAPPTEPTKAQRKSTVGAPALDVSPTPVLPSAHAPPDATKAQRKSTVAAATLAPAAASAPEPPSAPAPPDATKAQRKSTVAAATLAPAAASAPEPPSAPADATKAQRKSTVGAPALAAGSTPVPPSAPAPADPTKAARTSTVGAPALAAAPTPVPQRKPTTGTPPPGQLRKSAVGAAALASPTTSGPEVATALTAQLTPVQANPPPPLGDNDGEPTDPMKVPLPPTVTVDELTAGASTVKRVDFGLLKTVPVTAWSEPEASASPLEPEQRTQIERPEMAEPPGVGTLQVIATIVVVSVVVLAIAWVLL